MDWWFRLRPGGAPWDRDAARVHPLLRTTGGWYEEDAAWAAVATAWPDLFTGLERRQAEETLRHSWPDAWEAIHGRALVPGESRTRDGEAFARDHASDWVVISAIYSDQHRGFTEVIATRGGRRDPKSEECRFLCVDRGDAKLPIIEKLESLNIPFVDVGMGIDLVDNQLHGIVRTTTSTELMRAHVRGKKRIGLSAGPVEDLYAKNIQVADLNALNAAMAVIKWKKLFGFYLDLEGEHHCTYTLDGNMLLNEDQP